MTLFKQIALLVSSTLIVLLLVVIASDLGRTSGFLQGQLRTTAQDMSTTLGITIGNLPDGHDPAALEVLFNAVFDSGFYSSIQLIGVDGQMIHQKSRALNVEGVPDWFLNNVKLAPASGSIQVMQGWSQLGRLQIVIHPGFAYRNLYENLVVTIQWFLLLFFALLILLWIVLRYLLMPLQKVKDQADAINDNRFVLQTEIPRTIELKRVVEAMNAMVSKVRDIFSDQEKTLNNYQQMLYRDSLTNLGNKRLMLDQLQQTLADAAGSHGCMAIIKIQGYETVREKYGYASADSLVNALARMLEQSTARHQLRCVSRFNDDEFAFLAETNDTLAHEYLKTLFAEFQSLTSANSEYAEVQLQGGICGLETGSAISNVLSSIDYCLSKAINRGPYSIELKAFNSSTLPQGKMQWREWLENILQNKRFFLAGQLVMRDDQPVHRELFIRARNQEGQTIPASIFMPMVSSLGMSLDIDKEVFRLLVNSQKNLPEIPVAVNLSAAFLEFSEATEAFERLLSDCRNKNINLAIESSHHILIQHPETCVVLAERARHYQHQFGLDNFDLGLTTELLQNGLFDYVKINAKTLADLGNNETPTGYRALRTITDTLNIEIIAVGVDSEALFDDLKTLGIKTFQGNLLDQPKPI